MTDLDKMLQWLQTFPQWNGQKLYVDYTGADPDNCGLFPAGLEEISRREDVLGNVTVRNKYHFALYRVTTGQQEGKENAAWLLALQAWIQAQSAAGLAPVFGDVPAQERIRGEKGRLQQANQTGTGKYLMTITAEFTKIYKNKGE